MMKKLGMMTMLVSCLVVVLGLTGSASAYVWWDGGPGATGTDWSVAANWDGDALPLATDNPAIGVASLTAGVGLLPMPVVSTDVSGTEYAQISVGRSDANPLGGPGQMKITAGGAPLQHQVPGLLGMVVAVREPSVHCGWKAVPQPATMALK